MMSSSVFSSSWAPGPRWWTGSRCQLTEDSLPLNKIWRHSLTKSFPNWTEPGTLGIATSLNVVSVQLDIILHIFTRLIKCSALALTFFFLLWIEKLLILPCLCFWLYPNRSIYIYLNFWSGIWGIPNTLLVLGQSLCALILCNQSMRSRSRDCFNFFKSEKIILGIGLGKTWHQKILWISIVEIFGPITLCLESSLDSRRRQGVPEKTNSSPDETVLEAALDNNRPLFLPPFHLSSCWAATPCGKQSPIVKERIKIIWWSPADSRFGQKRVNSCVTDSSLRNIGQSLSGNFTSRASYDARKN